MRFEPVGPYSLGRRDLVAAALVISFVTGSRATRWKSWLILAVAVLLMLLGLSDGDPTMLTLGAALPVLVFLLAPALRSTKQVRHITLYWSPDGLVAETPVVRTTYKWSTIGTVRKIGSRLYVMISHAHALVVPVRGTGAANVEALLAALHAHGRERGEARI